MSSAEVGSKEMCLLVEFVATPYHSWLVGELALSHAVSDVCLVGPRGCGKSALVRQLATILGYRTETIQLYQVPYRTYLFSTVVIAVPLRYPYSFTYKTFTDGTGSCIPVLYVPL